MKPGDRAKILKEHSGYGMYPYLPTSKNDLVQRAEFFLYSNQTFTVISSICYPRAKLFSSDYGFRARPYDIHWLYVLIDGHTGSGWIESDRVVLIEQ